MPKKKAEEDNSLQMVEEEALAESEAEVQGHESSDEFLAEGEVDDEQAEAMEAEKGAGDVAEIPAEVAAINMDNDTAMEAEKETAKIAGEQKKPTKRETKKAVVKKTRSRRYKEFAQNVQAGHHYPIDEAIELVKATATTKFDSSVEVHIKMVEKKGKKGADESKRGLFHLPHGLGKDLKIVVLDEKMVDEIAKTKKVNFDIAIAAPAMMPKIGKVAKILGPKGKMPNPKFGTVTDDPDKIKEEIAKGRVEYRIDASNVIHQMIGKSGWENDKLKENLLTVLQSIAKKSIQSVVLTSTMGPGIRVEW